MSQKIVLTSVCEDCHLQFSKTTIVGYYPNKAFDERAMYAVHTVMPRWCDTCWPKHIKTETTSITDLVETSKGDFGE